MKTIDSIVQDQSLSVQEKTELVAEFLSREPDLGGAKAVQLLLSTSDSGVANFTANHLALLPGYLEEKRKIVDRLVSEGGEMTVAASELVQFLPRDQVRRILELFLADPSNTSPLYNLAFETALYFPDELRRFSDKIENPRLQEGMLSGAPDEKIAELAARYTEDEDANTLVDLGRTHTEKAGLTLMKIANDIPKDQKEEWLIGIENTGRNPDGTGATVYHPSFRGFARKKGETPHVMGGIVRGVAPACPACETAADRILTLKAADLPYDLNPKRDPSFYWFGCSCNALSSIHLQIVEKGIQVLIGPATDKGSGDKVLPGELSMLLDEHPNQTGRSLESTGGSGRHQVGGFPPWVNFDSFPVCPLCQKAMHFLASIDSGMSPFGRIGFNGILYGFWCNACSTSTTLRQA